jgi:hypothetical protein
MERADGRVENVFLGLLKPIKQETVYTSSATAREFEKGEMCHFSDCSIAYACVRGKLKETRNEEKSSRMAHL